MIELINVGRPCESRPGLHEDDQAKRFISEKARYYQSLADDFEGDGIDGLVDDVTIGQLAGILYEIDSRGRINFEPKEKAKERGVPSPDRAEALMLALGETPPLYEFKSIRDLERPKLGSRRRLMLLTILGRTQLVAD